MNKAKNTLTGFFIICVICASYSTISARDNDLDRIFSSAIEAVGAATEIKKIRSIEVFADCLGPKGKYSTQIISFRDGKTRFTQQFSYPNEPSDIFINNRIAWQKSDLSLVSPFQKLVVNLHEYQRMSVDFQKMFHDFALLGTEIFENRPSIKVQAKNELNGTIYLYFDVETKLLTGYVLPIPDSQQTVKNVFTKWKRVGKLKLPTKVTATDSSGDWVLDFQKISFNKSDSKIFVTPPRVSDLAELMRLQEQQKTAHLNYKAEMFVEMFAENLTQVQRGNISTRTRAENLFRFKNYFDTFKFIEWENLKSPVIKISKDGTLATIIVQKRVRGTYKNDKGQDVLDHTDFAWLEVWEKIDGQWKVVTVASTEKVVENSK